MSPCRFDIRSLLLMLSLALGGIGKLHLAAQTNEFIRREVEERFLKFCDLAAAELNKELTPFLNRTNADPATHHMPFFEDAHAVRALAVAYDMTGKRAYLDACERWSDRIITYQEQMIPRGAYYMNHSRAPGEDKGQWNVADCGSIGMGVLATAVRCDDPAAKARYLKSVKAFAQLVMDNYVGPEGGISNGLWPEYAGEWWCSTATFGTLMFVLYEETGEEQYLKVAKKALDWMLRQDFREVKPITFEQRPSGIIFYCFELYAAGLKHLPADRPQYENALRQIDRALDWMVGNQRTRGANVPSYLEKNVDMAAMPYLIYAFARQVPRLSGITAAADAELKYIGDILLADGGPNVSRLMVWEVMTWGMLSHAERLQPGALCRGSKTIEPQKQSKAKANPPTVSLPHDLDPVVPPLMAKHKVPGVSIVGIEDRRIAWERQYGVRRAGEPQPVDSQTVFEAASMSKLPAVYVALKLVEQRKLDLDRPLSEYLDQPYLTNEPLHLKITARMVLSHTTGFPNWREGGWRSGGPLPVLHEPGSKFGYSGEGFLYLQRVIEHITGEPFEPYIQRTLLKPLGMNIGSYVWQEDFAKLAADGHNDKGGLPPRRELYREANAAYSLYCTPKEYALFILEILKQDRSAPHSLSVKSLQAMFTRTTKAESRKPIVRRGGPRSEPVYYGLGWVIDASAFGDLFYHSGSNGTGFRCYCEFDPERGSGIVIMTNAAGGAELWRELIAVVGEP